MLVTCSCSLPGSIDRMYPQLFSVILGSVLGKFKSTEGKDHSNQPLGKDKMMCSFKDKMMCLLLFCIPLLFVMIVFSELTSTMTKMGLLGV